MEALDKTAVYRTKDPLAHFLVRVTLKKVTSASVLGTTIAHLAQDLERARIEGQDAPTNENQPQSSVPPVDEPRLDLSTALQEPQEQETKTISWQLKCFSPREVATYRDLSHCITPLQESYHHEILRLESDPAVSDEARKTRIEGRIFSYVDHDDFDSMHEGLKTVTTSSKERPSFLVERTLTVRKRHGEKVSKRKQMPPASGAILSEKQKSTRVVDSAFQVMYVMAHTAPAGQDAFMDLDDTLLCTITVNNAGIISVTPDFTHSRPPYRIETYHGEVYEYTLHHVSSAMTAHDLVREAALQQQIYARRQEMIANCVGDEFTARPMNTAAPKYHVFGEIVSTWGFERQSDLYVHMVASLPAGWDSPLSSDVYGGGGDVHASDPDNMMPREVDVFTQISNSVSQNGQEVSYYGVPFEFNGLLSEHPHSLNDSPKIYFQVAALDSWDRHYTEGYCSYNVPRKAGVYDLTIPTWRPYGDRFARLRRHFLGGAPELSDIHYTGVPDGHDSKVLSRFGFTTQTSGYLRIRLNVIKQQGRDPSAQQSQPFPVNDYEPNLTQSHDPLLSSTMDNNYNQQTGEPSGFTSTTTAVLAAFQRAHQRMTTLTTGLSTSLDLLDQTSAA